MFRFFENLVDPYQPYPEQDAPPTKLWPFLKEYVLPFRAVFAVTFLLSVAIAAADVINRCRYAIRAGVYS
jgi:ATP-binding cassette subfamily B multidrug efflux pump